MKAFRLMIVIALALSIPALSIGQDIATLVNQAANGSDEARLGVIQAGLPAVPELVNAIATREGRPAERAARTLGWVIEFAGKDAAVRPRAEWTAVNLLLDREQPLAVRKTVARYLWHVASDRSVAALEPFAADADIGDDARWSLQNIPGEAARNALLEASVTSSGATRAAVIATIGRRSDAPLGFLKTAARDADAIVRLAAVGGLGNMGTAPAAHALLARVPVTEGAEQAAVLTALNAAAAKLPDASAKWVYERVIAANGSSEASEAALNGLAGVGDKDSVPKVAPFLGSNDAALQVASANALATIPCGCATGALVAALDGATSQQARPILSALGDRADATAVGAVIPVARVGNADIQILALTALGRMGDPTACEVILEAAQNSSSIPRVVSVALEAYSAIAAAQLAAGDVETARSIYESALQMAKTDAQKVGALNGLGKVASPKSLPAIGAELNADGAVQAAAIAAHLASSDSLARVDGAAAIDALMKLLDVVDDPAQVRAVVLRLGSLGSSIDVGSRQGFITHWWVLGHYDSGGDYAATDEVFAPERGVDLAAGDGDRKWEKHHTLDVDGLVDYVGMFGKNNDAACYAYAEVSLDEALDGKILCGSDDSIVIWLNGEEVHRFKGPRGCTVDGDATDVSFKSGENTVLIKVIQGSGDWSSCVRLVDADGKPLSFEQKTE